jgi:hypothetical protein
VYLKESDNHTSSDGLQMGIMGSGIGKRLVAGFSAVVLVNFISVVCTFVVVV